MSVDEASANAAGDGPDVKSVEKAELIVDDSPPWPTNVSETAAADTGRSLALRLLHWGPLITLFLIFFIGSTACYLNTMWWPLHTLSGALHFAMFLFWNYSTLSNFLQAAYTGGGYLPKEWLPPNKADECRLQQCTVCRGFKAPRAHHCSKCQRCVLKMDHHCPWINNCVGHRNHASFVCFLGSAVIGCSHAALIIICSIYHGLHLNWYIRFGSGDEPLVELSLYSLLISVVAVAFAAGVAVAVSVLLIFQLQGIKRNKTSLEDFITLKATRSREEPDTDLPPFVYPYDLGSRRNFGEVFHVRGNGIWWPIRAGCTQFTLSEEQLRQKAYKLENARLVRVTRGFGGGYCSSIRIGCRVWICQPISDEARVAVEVGQLWLVTRANRHWLFGKREDEHGKITKGWLPRVCAELLPIQYQEDTAAPIDN